MHEIAEKYGLPRLMFAVDVKKYFNFGNDNLNELLHRKDFPSFQINEGGRWYVDVDELKNWLTKRKRKSSL